MSEWREYILEDIIEKFIDYRGKTPNKTTIGIPLITAKVVKDGKILEPNEFIAEEDYLPWMTRGFPKVNDIVLTTEAPLGEIALLKDEKVALAQRIITLQTKKDVCYSPFLKYYFQNDEGQQLLQSRSTGTTVEGIKSAELKKIEVSLPPLPEQERIAEVLSSLDDKIDLLHRNNKTLEQLAETLFRQWFVEEAETKPVKHFGKIICGKTPSKNNSNFFNGPIPFLKIPDMHGKAFVFKTTDSLTEEGKLSQSNKTIPPFSISVSCIATVGLVTINAFECQTNQQINSIVPNEKNYRYYLYNYFKSITDDLIQRASSGSVTHNLNTSDFSNIEIPFFSDDLFTSFDDVVDPLYQKVFINEQQIQQLETLRDTLLPKLMSGAVRVED